MSDTPKVVIAAIVWNRPEPETMDCIVRDVQLPEVVGYVRSSLTYLGAARDEATLGAVTEYPELTHVLFVDGDMTWGEGSLQELLNADKEIISAWYHARAIPHAPVHRYASSINPLYPLEDDLEEKVKHLAAKEARKVLFTGGGFLLVKREVFKRLEPPWFRFMPRLSLKAQMETDRCAVCDLYDHSPLLRYSLHTDGCVKEDAGFGRYAVHNGVTPWVTSQTIVGHIRREAVGPHDWMQYLKANEEKKA